MEQSHSQLLTGWSSASVGSGSPLQTVVKVGAFDLIDKAFD